MDAIAYQSVKTSSPTEPTNSGALAGTEPTVVNKSAVDPYNQPAALENMNGFRCWKILVCAAGGLLVVFSVIVGASGGLSIGGLFISAPVSYFLFAIGMTMVTESGVITKRS